MLTFGAIGFHGNGSWQNGLSRLSSRQRVHEVLHRRRRITMEQAQALHEWVAIPADVMMQA
jgi:antitoxin component HigA of HigAB toxin-antitoxin module